MCACQCLIAVAHNLKFTDHMPLLKTLSVYFSFFVNGDFQPLRESIYNRCTYSVESPGYFISSAAELSPCVENRKNHFHCRYAGFMIDSYWNPPAIIPHSNGIVLINYNFYGVTISSQCLIHRIIHNLIYQMMKSPAGSTSNIHARPFPDSLQAL